MEDKLSDKEKLAKNPNQDSVVTDNTDGPAIVHDNMKGGAKNDGDPENPDDQAADEDVLVTNESQKGKAVDEDPELEQGVE